MTKLFVVRLITVSMSVLVLSAVTLSVAEIIVPDNLGGTCQDDASLLALIGYQVIPPPYNAEVHFFHQEKKTSHQPSPIFPHTYRGPPSL